MAWSKNIILLILCLFALVNLFFALPPKNDLLVILYNPALSLKDRFRLKVGSPQFEYLEFLKANLPEDAAVSLPPDTPAYLLYGNYLYMNYFLYPRTLIPNYDQSATPSASADYALVVTGVDRQTNRPCCLWPADTEKTPSLILFQSQPLLGILKLK